MRVGVVLALAALLSAAVLSAQMPAQRRADNRCPIGCVNTSELSTPVTATFITPDYRGPFVVAKPSKSGTAKPTTATTAP